jgi:hypothetical protein
MRRVTAVSPPAIERLHRRASFHRTDMGQDSAMAAGGRHVVKRDGPIDEDWR